MSAEPRKEPGTRRPYRQVARARSSAGTRARILAATEHLLSEGPPATLSLDAVARAAATTVPTVLRHFPSKEVLVAAALGRALARIRAERPQPAPGDHLGAARVLAREYEVHAELLRAAEASSPGTRRELEAARRLHRDWLARTFARTLSPLPPVVHRRRLAQLVAVSGPAPWRSLREAEHLGPAQATAALAELLRALAG
jgi:AcrR family transcriptional regulator